MIGAEPTLLSGANFPEKPVSTSASASVPASPSFAPPSNNPQENAIRGEDLAPINVPARNDLEMEWLQGEASSPPSPAIASGASGSSDAAGSAAAASSGPDQIAGLLSAPEKPGRLQRRTHQSVRSSDPIIVKESVRAEMDVSKAKDFDLRPDIFSAGAISQAQKPMQATAPIVSNPPAAAQASHSQAHHGARGVAHTAMQKPLQKPNARELELTAKLQSLQADHKRLQGEIEDIKQAAKEQRIDISSNNWDLERATKLYQESERQAQRLAQQLQRERAAHRQEKAKLEQMLFNPKLTEEAQLARLAELERALEEARDELRRYKR